MHRAEADTAQLIRVQQIPNQLAQGRRHRDKRLLVGGLEPPAQRATYDDAIAATGTLIAQAAAASPQTPTRLQPAHEQVVACAATIERGPGEQSAWGFPVGARYLRSPGAGLRTNALPILDNLVAANAERAGGEMDASIGWVFLVVGVLVLGGLVAARVWLARRFRRTINTGLAVATALILLGLVGGGIGPTCSPAQ